MISAYLAAWLLAAPLTLQTGIENRTPLSEAMWDCRAERTLANGTAYASRSYRKSGELYGGDFFRWNAAGYNPAAPRAPIEWELSFIMAAERPEPFDDRRIKLVYQLRSEEPLPEVMLLHIRRPMPVEPHGIVASTALTTLTFRHPYGSPTSGSGDLPLGDLLAYAGPYQSLEWFMTDRHNQYGHARPLAKGVLSIAALREGVASFHDMRRELKRKGKAFRKACPLRDVLLPTRHPH